MQNIHRLDIMFYGHYTDQSNKILLEQIFTAGMPLLVATSAVDYREDGRILLYGVYYITYVQEKGFRYSLPALGLELIPVYRQSARRWLSHPPSGRLSLLSTRPAVTFPAVQHYRPLAGNKLYCLVTEAHRWELGTTCPRLLHSFCPEKDLNQRSTRCTTAPPTSPMYHSGN